MAYGSESRRGSTESAQAFSKIESQTMAEENIFFQLIQKALGGSQEMELEPAVPVVPYGEYDKERDFYIKMIKMYYSGAESDWKGRKVEYPRLPKEKKKAPKKVSEDYNFKKEHGKRKLWISLRGAGFTLDFTVDEAGSLPAVLDYPKCIKVGGGAGIEVGYFMTATHLVRRPPKDLKLRTFKRQSYSMESYGCTAIYRE